MGLTHIKTKAISISDPPERRAVFKATVTMRTEDGLLDFVGHGERLFHSESQHHPRVTLEGASITSKFVELILTNAGLDPTPANSSEFTKAS